jgi:hypothetical protein
MIKLKRLFSEVADKQRPDQSLDQLLRDERTIKISDWLYHGTPLEGLKGMLSEGIYGQEHGEMAEDNTFSTSINSGVLHYFSEGDGDTGLQFKVENVKVLVLDDYLTKLAAELRGSGMDPQVDDEEAFETFCLQYKMPRRKYDGDFYLPWNYLTSLGVDAFMQEYAYNQLRRGGAPYNDESEICFLGNSINRLNHLITSIWVDGEEYDDKVAALRAIEDKLNDKA